MSRGRETPAPTIRDPAIAVAAAKCWLARWGNLDGVPVGSYHPREYGFCEYPEKRLIDAVAGFIAWADPPAEMGEPVALQSSVEAFLALSRQEQSVLVQKAQGYIEEEDESAG